MKPDRKIREKAADWPERGDRQGFQLTEQLGTRAAVIHPNFKQTTRRNKCAPAHAREKSRTPEARLEEAVGLARAIDLEIVLDMVVPVHAIRPATLFGAGKVEELKAYFAGEDAGLVIIDAALTPGQQRNLERAWKLKVLDRTGLILEIFAERAATREGRLQVELARLNYQKSRLVRSWTHLERQRGALGFVGGPGETQKEADRRMIQDQIDAIEKDLKTVTRTRTLHRKSRKAVPFPIVAMVGYTNAGKSTLFNRLTRSEVLAEDMLFATLDPTMRGLDLPDGGKIILSDTVGFISDLPTGLVAAFRATLEEVREADLLLHVRDLSTPDSEAEARDVEHVLDELNLGDGKRPPVLEVWNKIDLLDDTARETVVNHAGRKDDAVAVSAHTGAGMDALIGKISERIAINDTEVTVRMDGGNGAGLNWLHEHCQVLTRTDREDGMVDLRLRVPKDALSRVECMAVDGGVTA